MIIFNWRGKVNITYCAFCVLLFVCRLKKIDLYTLKTITRVAFCFNLRAECPKVRKLAVISPESNAECGTSICITRKCPCFVFQEVRTDRRNCSIMATKPLFNWLPFSRHYVNIVFHEMWLSTQWSAHMHTSIKTWKMFALFHIATQNPFIRLTANIIESCVIHEIR